MSTSLPRKGIVLAGGSGTPQDPPRFETLPGDNIFHGHDFQPLLNNAAARRQGASIFATTFTNCELPTSLVFAYALAVTTSGKAEDIFVVGFDGFGADDPRTQEVENLFASYFELESARPICSLTTTMYSIPAKSIYAY
ncbi:MAG: hypothetical protein GX772_02040 [Alcaligenaceae bacterium]|nr:hypothetical protein [Alcaligenaceae bacterium]